MMPSSVVDDICFSSFIVPFIPSQCTKTHSNLNATFDGMCFSITLKTSGFKLSRNFFGSMEVLSLWTLAIFGRWIYI